MKTGRGARLKLWLSKYWPYVAGALLAAVVLWVLVSHKKGAASVISLPAASGGGGGASGSGDTTPSSTTTGDPSSIPTCDQGSHLAVRLASRAGSGGRLGVMSAVEFYCAPDVPAPAAQDTPRELAPGSAPTERTIVDKVTGIFKTWGTGGPDGKPGYALNPTGYSSEQVNSGEAAAQAARNAAQDAVNAAGQKAKDAAAALGAIFTVNYMGKQYQVTAKQASDLQAGRWHP